MKFIESVNDMKTAARSQKKAGKSIGLVPTMGYLHKGHMSLIKESKAKNGYTVISIFVNPIQFGPNEDYSKYPRDIGRDIKMAEEAGVDVIFAPSAEEMYPAGYNTYVDVEGITDVLCGKTRQGHFKGVATVVAKLINIVGPDRAYFGQKDAQQAAVIKKMVKDLNMDAEIEVCPIIREPDGLAMSSRNVYLSPAERKSAVILPKALFKAEEMIRGGERDKNIIQKHIEDMIRSETAANIEYVEILEADTLKDIDHIKGKVILAAAVIFGKTRLIDNIILEV